MKYHLIILSMACMSCLVPPALGHGFIAKAAAIKGGALLAKGAALKGAVLLAKGAILKGAVLKGAAVFSAGLPAASPVLVEKPVTMAKPVYVVRPLQTRIPPEFPGLLLSHLKGLFGIVHTSLKAKASGALSLVAALSSAKSRPPVVYEASQPLYGVPIVEKVVS